MTDSHQDTVAGAPSPAPGQPNEESPAVASAPHLAAGPFTMLLAAILAAFVCWISVGRLGLDRTFEPSESLMAEMHRRGMNDAVPLSPEAVAEIRRLTFGNAAVVFAVLGGVLGGICGAAEGSFRRRLVPALAGLLGGAVFGAAAGAAAGPIAAFVQGETLLELSRLAKTMVVQAVVWMILAVGVGAAVAIPSRSLRVVGLTVSGAMVGGGLAAVLYCFIWPILLPTHSTERLIPDRSDDRLYWMLLAFSLIAVIAAWQGRSLPRRPR